MSGPHGGGQPPAILVEWSSRFNAWYATAIVAPDAGPIDATGPSTTLGSSPAAALDGLLGRRFGILADQDCAPTLLSIDRGEA